MKRNPVNDFSAQSLIKKASHCIKKIGDNTTTITPSISLHDNLMSALAVFKLKYPSLLLFDKYRQDPGQAHNLKKLFHIDRAPSDTAMRERLDKLDPSLLRKTFTTLFSVAQRNKALDNFRFLDGYYLCSIDGTGCFHSDRIHCDNCCVKKRRDGTISYYHQMLCGSIVHPDLSNVIPLCPEPILKQDGSTKNDCERNASKRFLNDLKREHPHLKLIIVEDSLASNAPHIRLLEMLQYKYILGAKPADHVWLFDWVKHSKIETHEIIDKHKNHHRFEFVNSVPLNDSNSDVKVNFLEHWETRPNGKIIHHTWVTNILLTHHNIVEVMKGGRARWKIENETINTLKNQGYNFEHNYGHGYQNLSTVLSFLMMLAFLIDELGFIGCKITKRVKEVLLGKKRMWEKIRAAFDCFMIQSWQELFDSFLSGIGRPALVPDTS